MLIMLHRVNCVNPPPSVHNSTQYSMIETKFVDVAAPMSQEVATRRKSEKPLQYIIIDLTPVPHIDATAVRLLQDLVHEYRAAGLQLVISNPSNRVFGMMECSGLLDEVGEAHSFTSYPYM